MPHSTANVSINANNVPKRGKLKARHRREQILALQLAGKTQEQIAQYFGVSRMTIVRDLEELRPSTEHVASILERAQVKLEQVWNVEERIERLATLGKEAKNEAVSLAAIGIGNDIAGVVTEKELVRTRRDAALQPQAMFMLPPGTHVSVSVNTTSSKVAHYNSAVQNAVDVTPTDSTTDK